jgi:hypothetical protein
VRRKKSGLRQDETEVVVGHIRKCRESKEQVKMRLRSLLRRYQQEASAATLRGKEKPESGKINRRRKGRRGDS